MLLRVLNNVGWVLDVDKTAMHQQMVANSTLWSLRSTLLDVSKARRWSCILSEAVLKHTCVVAHTRGMLCSHIVFKSAGFDKATGFQN